MQASLLSRILVKVQVLSRLHQDLFNCYLKFNQQEEDPDGRIKETN